MERSEEKKSARVIYSNEPKNIDNKWHNQFGESGGATASGWMRVFFFCPHLLPAIICPLLSLWPPRCTVSIHPWPPLLRPRRNIGDDSALRSEMSCIMTSVLSGEPRHHNIAPAGSLLFPNLFFYCRSLINSHLFRVNLSCINGTEMEFMLFCVR